MELDPNLIGIIFVIYAILDCIGGMIAEYKLRDLQKRVRDLEQSND